MIQEVADSSHVSLVRRMAVDLAGKLQFSEAKSGQVALVATEMATNLIKHGAGGQISLSQYDGIQGGRLELLSLDSGAGIADVARAMEDGYSSAGSAGSGLGAIRRQSDEFAIYSRPQQGTVIMARFKSGGSAGGPSNAVVCAVTAPYPGEQACGDAWACASPPAGTTMILVDGTGHGAEAARAAETAIAVFRKNSSETCTALAEIIHRALLPTRGAAVGIARIDETQRLVRFVGVGNIAGAVTSSAGVRRMVSQNGIAGHVAPRIREFTYSYDAHPAVILHSDGLSAKWDLARYPGLASGHPSLIAGVLFRDFRRGRDDATVAVLRV